MLSVIEISISGDVFLFLNDMSSRQLEQTRLLSEQFRKQKKISRYAETRSVVNLFCSEIEQQLGLKLHPVSIATVITLK